MLIAIVGCARSGSTLIEGTLQDRFDITSLGEVSYIWERGRLKNELCGCGQPFDRCEFWREVLREAFGTVSETDARRYDRAFAAARGSLVDAATLRGRLPAPDPLFGEIARALYAAAGRVGGDRPLVDSSKVPRFAASLQTAGVGRLHVLHIFRDARGNAHSLLTPKPRPQARDDEAKEIGKSKSLMHAIARWSLRNVQSQRLLAVASGNAATLSYERFCEEPEARLAEVRAIFALAPRNTAVPAQWHSVSGNPMRFDGQNRAIRLDERWRTAMPAANQRLTRLLTRRLQNRLEAADLASLAAARAGVSGTAAL